MTLRSPIFRKLLWSGFLLIAVTLLVVDFYLTRYTAQQQEERVEERLESQARILSGELERVAPAALQRWALEAHTRARTRVTVINSQGLVLADSEPDSTTTEDRAGGPEIGTARERGVGASVRHSATLDRDVCYVALRVTATGDAKSVLRLAAPLEDVEAQVAAVRWRILTAALVAAFVALVFAHFFSRSFTTRIDRLRALAEGLAEAHPPVKYRPEDGDELGALGRSLHKTSGQIRDLVDRLKLESARREAILVSMVEGVLAVDGELRVTFCNASFARAVAAPSPLPELLPLLDLVRDPELIDLLKDVLERGQAVKQRLQLSAAQGRTFEVQAAPLETPSGPGALAILHDITELEHLERVRRDFVANVSHELRTPLTAIRGYAETLLEGALEDPEHNRRFLEIIKANAIRLNYIASDLLSLSELESGKAPAEPERFFLREAVEAALRTVESEARRRDVTLSRGVLEDVRLRADRGQLEQALVNLLDNAVKFNHPGGEVRVEACLTLEGNVHITIADSGIGIPSGDLPRIFERFYRVDRARSREVGGTGLGLSIVKHIVERMGGTLAVESQLGRGSTFSLILPAASAWKGAAREEL